MFYPASVIGGNPNSEYFFYSELLLAKEKYLNTINECDNGSGWQ